jgi:hypothetical protein
MLLTPLAHADYAQQIDQRWLSTSPAVEKKETTHLPKTEGWLAWFDKKMGVPERPELQPPVLDPHTLKQLAAQSREYTDLSTIADFVTVEKLEIARGEGEPTASCARQVSSVLQPDGSRKKLTTTVHGERALVQVLSHPTADLDIIRARQQNIRTLVDQPEALAEMTRTLARMQDGEKELLAYFLPTNEVNESVFGKLYSGRMLNFLNNSTAGLEAGTRLGNLGTVYGVGSPVFNTILGLAIGRYLAKNFIVPEGDPYPEANGILVPNVRENFFSSLKVATISFKNSAQFVAEGFQLMPFKWKAIVLSASSPLIALMSWSAYKVVDEFKFRRDIANYLQTNLTDISAYIRGAQHIRALAHAHPDLNFDTAHLDLALAQALHGQSALKELVALFNTQTFTGDASFFSITGRVLRAHKLIEQCKNSLGEIMAEIGVIDAQVAIARLMVAHKDRDARFCFVNFVQSDKPMMQAKGFWNPFVEKYTLVLNDILMSDKTSHIILTGPNTGGKSTCIKGLMINSMLAHSFGVAAAQSFDCTPFHVVRCYLNVNDDTIAGESLFFAEVKRAKELMAAVRSLKNGQFAFIIMDEIFSGTNPDKAQEISYDFLTELSGYPCLFIDATHFPKLTELEKDGICANYQMEAYENDKGRIVCTYKMTPGISQVSNAEQLVNDAGVHGNGITW